MGNPSPCFYFLFSISLITNVIQSEAKNLDNINMYAFEILPPFGRLNDKTYLNLINRFRNFSKNTFHSTQTIDVLVLTISLVPINQRRSL